jgi:hypothetical protein
VKSTSLALQVVFVVRQDEANLVNLSALRMPRDMSAPEMVPVLLLVAKLPVPVKMGS